MEVNIDILIKQMESVLQHPIVGRDLFQVAITHRSYANEAAHQDLEDNERLEFLGDAVIDLVVTNLLMQMYPNEREGFLSKHRAALVNERSLADIARELCLGAFLLLGKGEERTEGRNKDSLLADAFEAVIAALYLSGGLGDVTIFVKHYFASMLPETGQDLDYRDYKTLLQEMTQKRLKKIPTYTLLKEMGPDHDKIFESEVTIDHKVYGRGQAKNKKDSEQLCAKEALMMLEKDLENHS